jgi:hypothetical protein
MSEPQPYDLRPLKRYITGLDESGKAIFLKTIDSDLPTHDLKLLHHDETQAPKRAALAYATDNLPPSLKDSRDVQTYEQFLKTPPGITIRNGIVFRILEFPPGSESAMHKTKSLDFGVVLEGSVIAGLDSGEKQILHRGDSLIQRATNHDWTNASKTEWARMLFVLNGAEVDGSDDQYHS